MALRARPLKDEVEATEIAAEGRRQAFARGTAIVRQGDGRGRSFYLEDGEVAVEVNGRQVATVRAGEFVGELSALYDRPRNATLRALTDVTAIAFPSWHFLALLNERPAWRTMVHRTASAHLGAQMTTRGLRH